MDSTAVKHWPPARDGWRGKPLYWVIPFASFLLIVLALVVSDISAQSRADERTNMNLRSSAMEQAETLNAVIDGQFATLGALSAELATHSVIRQENLPSHLRRLSQNTSFQHIRYAKPDGTCYGDDGAVTDVARLESFQRAMQGQSTIQCIADEQSGSGKVFVLAVPMIAQRSVAGALMASYRSEKLNRLIVPEIYDGQAYSIICTENGEIVVDAENPNDPLTEENVFVSFASVTLERGLTAERLRMDMAGGGSGFFSYEADVGKRYVVYIPLDIASATGERWFLFNGLPAAIVNAEARRSAIGNALMFGLILLAAAVSFAFILFLERKHKKELEQKLFQLHASEEQIKVAIATTGLNIARYDLKTGLYYNESELLFSRGFGREIPNVPEAFVQAGLVEPSCVADFCAFYEKLRRGETCASTVALLVPDGGYRWFHMNPTFVCDENREPYQAILAFRDVTEQQQRDSVYAKWQQSIRQKGLETYTLFHCNLSKGASFDSMDGSLLGIAFSPDIDTFNARTLEYAGRLVHPDDYGDYVALLNSDYLLASYYRGARQKTLDYRERVPADQYRWLRVTVEMVQSPTTGDIEVFLLYEDVSARKAEEQAAHERAATDPLTGVLNRTAFTDQFNRLIGQERPNARHALLLMDVDGFKAINDIFGHAVGDQALIDIAASLRMSVREGDLLGRLGGDAFLLCLRDIPNQAVIEKKAVQIQALMRRTFGLDVQISASLGIVLYPDDGRSFDELYHNVDLALYAAKDNGKDSFSFFRGGASQARPADHSASAAEPKKHPRKRRMLVIDDQRETVDLLADEFADQYAVESYDDESAAMIRLRLYGASLSVVLLSLDIPNVDGLTLLERIKSCEGLSSLPVIALSQMDEREVSLEALRRGACEFALKPINRELIRVRVASAVSKAENARLRAQNEYLRLQSGDGAKYRTIFENTGAVAVEFDWNTNTFTYDPSISEQIDGTFDDRSLWHILMSDMVADSMDVKAIQTLVHNLANDRTRTFASMDVLLKTPAKKKHWFRMNAFKRVNELKLTSKIVLTFADINEDVLANDKLRYQAEHDILTGVYNRGTFLKMVEEAVRDQPAASYYLLCCDIDDFRFINERFGREEGDTLLRCAAEKLNVYADAVHSFTGRLSNDLFAILLPNLPHILEKADAIIQDFFSHYPLKAKITCRAGAYLVLDPTLSADSMLDMATIANNSIKGKYGARLVLYDESMNAKQVLEKEITDNMEAALEAGQFDVYIQPQFNHASGRLVGAEALVRWIDPLKGVISPGVFIPIFERNGFITRLDEYVWNRAAEYFHRWLEQGNDPVPLSVNVSREDTNDPQLCEKLLAIVKRHAVPIHLFRLEITESLFAEDTQRLISVVERLHQCGFLIEMDDFGSGYSSLNILKDVPVDVLKLDMRFFSGKDNLGRGGMIIHSVARMARWLNIPMIAEGVESRTQADFLLNVGCQTIQGFLYEKPIPVPDFEKLYLQNQKAGGMLEPSAETEMDAQAFWNPESIDSQLFTNYIGPALFFEFCQDQYEILRVNRSFLDAFGLQADTPLPANGLVPFYEDGLALFKAAIRQALASNQAVTIDVRYALREGVPLPARITLRVVGKRQDRAMLFAMLQA